MMKIVRKFLPKSLLLALLCALSLPLSTINAGLGYYAGRVAQGLTRGSLFLYPVGNVQDWRSNQQQTGYEQAGFAEAYRKTQESPTFRALAQDLSQKTGLPLQQIAIDEMWHPSTIPNAGASTNVSTPDCKRAIFGVTSSFLEK